jgi:hypothetical protein
VKVKSGGGKHPKPTVKGAKPDFKAISLRNKPRTGQPEPSPGVRDPMKNVRKSKG